MNNKIEIISLRTLSLSKCKGRYRGVNFHLPSPLQGAMLLLLLVFFSFFSTAQNTGLLENVKLTADGDRHERFDRIAFDFYTNRFTGMPQGTKQGDFSFGVSSYWYKDMPFGPKSRAAFAFGLGFSSINMHHNGMFTTTDSMGVSNYTVFEKFPDGQKVYKNKVSFNYVDLPLELRFRNMDGKHKLRFYPGFKGGVLVNNHTKFRDANSKVKIFDLPNRMIYQYGPTVRIMWNNFALYGFYSLTPLFEPNKGPQIYPISIGISWVRF